MCRSLSPTYRAGNGKSCSPITAGAGVEPVFFAAVFFTVAFLATGLLRTAFFAAGCTFAASARFNAHRRRTPARIAFLPAALIFLFFGPSGATSDGDSGPPLLAHLAFCARAIFLRVAALN